MSENIFIPAYLLRRAFSPLVRKFEGYKGTSLEKKYCTSGLPSVLSPFSVHGYASE